MDDRSAKPKDTALTKVGSPAKATTPKVTPGEFIRQVRQEASKVVWPTRKEAVQMTLYVFGFVVVMALFLWTTDKTLEWVFYDLILGWKK